jgi:hyaluronan synthase
VWTRPAPALAASLVEKVVTNGSIPLGWAMLGTLAVLTVADPTVLLRVLALIGVGAAFSMLYYLHSERSMRFVHGIGYAYFAFVSLWWIFPWAILTVRNKSWMTR